MRFAAASGQGRVTMQVSGFPRDECASASGVSPIHRPLPLVARKRLRVTCKRRIKMSEYRPGFHEMSNVRPSFQTTCLPEDAQEVTRYDLGGHTHYKLDCHFVWRTKFNRRIDWPVLSPFMVREIDTICRAKKLKRFGLTIAVNHVHLCARLRPDQSPAQLMRWIKSTTSKNAFEHFPQLAARFG
jgi:REP element-mobilizing transposase RayT